MDGKNLYIKKSGEVYEPLKGPYAWQNGKFVTLEVVEQDK